MAKKRSLDDLEDELAKVEAELAALEGRAPAKPKPKKKAAPAEEPPAAEPAPEPARGRKAPFGLGRKKEAAETAPVEERKPRFGLPFGKGAASAPAETEAAPEPAPKSRVSLPFGKRRDTAAPAVEPDTPALVDTHTDAPPVVARAPAVAIVDEPATQRREAIPVTDASDWRQEDGAWVRTVSATPTPVVRRILDEDGAIVREEPATRDDLDEATGAKAERGVGKLLGGAKALKGRFGRKSG